MLTQTSAANGAIIGVCLGVGICVITMILFLIIYYRTKIHDDTNIRRRIVTYSTFDNKPLLSKTEFRQVEEPPAPAPAPLPRIVVEPPPPPPPQPQPMPAVRRRSWAGAPDDNEWVLIKKITKSHKHTGVKIREIRDDENPDDSSSDEEEEQTRKVKRHVSSRRMDAYDLAMPMAYQPQPRMMGASYMVAQPGAYMMQPQMTTQIIQPRMVQPRMVQPQMMPAQMMPAQMMPAQMMPAQMMPAQMMPAQMMPAQMATMPMTMAAPSVMMAPMPAAQSTYMPYYTT